MAVTPVGNPYVESSDRVSDYPGASQALAERIDIVGVNPFADSAARATAIPSPTEGMMSSLNDTNEVERYDGATWKPVGGKVLQVVSVTSTTSTSTSSTSYVTTALAASLTPASTANKVLIFASIPWSVPTTSAMTLTIFRGTVAGTNLGNAGLGMGQVFSSATGRLDGIAALNFLDSPSTTSSQTFTVGFKMGTGTGTVQAFAGMSSLTLMEISA